MKNLGFMEREIDACMDTLTVNVEFIIVGNMECRAIDIKIMLIAIVLLKFAFEKITYL